MQLFFESTNHEWYNSFISISYLTCNKIFPRPWYWVVFCRYISSTVNTKSCNILSLSRSQRAACSSFLMNLILLTESYLWFILSVLETFGAPTCRLAKSCITNVMHTESSRMKSTGLLFRCNSSKSSH